MDVAADLDGNIYVADRENHVVQVYGEDGTFLRSHGGFGIEEGKFHFPCGIAVDQVLSRADGNIIRTLGTEGSAPGELKFPGSIAIGTDSSAIVVDHENHRVQFWDKDGNWLRSTGSKGNRDGELLFPWGVALGTVHEDVHTGNDTAETSWLLFVGDTNNHRIAVFNVASGAFVRNIGHYGDAYGQLRHPRGLAVDLFGRLVVSDQQNGRVQAFWPNGSFSYAVASLGHDDHQLWYPMGLAVNHKNHIIVADYGFTHRQQSGMPDCAQPKETF